MAGSSILNAVFREGVWAKRTTEQRLQEGRAEQVSGPGTPVLSLLSPASVKLESFLRSAVMGGSGESWAVALPGCGFQSQPATCQLGVLG